MIARYVEAAQLTNKAVRCIGVAVNSSNLSQAGIGEACDGIEPKLGLPCVDPIRDGVARLAAALD